MLKTIRIKNFAIIDELAIDFDKCFNVFTGETGAGKSIIINAINLLKGARSDISLIAKGKDSAIIEGSFTISDNMKAILDDAQIEYDDEVIIYRKIANNSQIRLNDRLVTANFLQRFFSEEIDIHSQKETWFLLKPTNQLKVIDQMMVDDPLKKELSNAYQAYLKAKEDLDNFNKQFEDGFDIDYLRYQYNELAKANLNATEEQDLIVQEKKSRDSVNTIQSLNKVLDEYYKTNGISESLYFIINHLNIEDDKVKESLDKLKEYYYEMEDIFEDFNKLKDSYHFDDSQIDKINERLFTYNSFKRKYQKSTEELIALQNTLWQDIDNYDNSEVKRNELTKALEDATNEYMHKALLLSQKRKEFAKKFEKDIINEVNSLNLPYFDFKVIFDTKEISIDGIDTVSFNIATNKNQDLKPISKVASGGEMSRILLAIKVVLAKLLNLSLIIFDEIDTGISGLAAKSVGQKMLSLSKNSQVIAISHLAQIAMYANKHFEVSKLSDDTSTISSIKELDEKGRIEAIAMMSSSSLSDNALSLASELLKEAHG